MPFVPGAKPLPGPAVYGDNRPQPLIPQTTAKVLSAAVIPVRYPVLLIRLLNNVCLKYLIGHTGSRRYLRRELDTPGTGFLNLGK